MADCSLRCITALCLVGLVASTHAGTHQIEGRIVGVHDGDTITLLDADNRQHKIDKCEGGGLWYRCGHIAVTNSDDLSCPPSQGVRL